MSCTNKKFFIFSSFRLTSKIVCASIWVIGLSIHAGNVAADQNSDFVDFLNTECNLTVIPAFNAACVAAGLGGGPSLPPNASIVSNLGVSGAQSRTSNLPDKDQRKFAEDEGDSGSAAGSDDDSWGLLLAAQYGETDRKNSNFENGYDSELSGIVIGFDYTFSGSLLAGVALGITADEVSFKNNAGDLDTDSNSLTFFSTWALNDNSALDAYLAVVDTEYDNRRNFAIGDPVVSGTASSSTDSSQTLAGIGYSLDWQLDTWLVGTYINLDYLETEIDGYSETGGAGFDLIYPGQSTESLTSTLGIRLSYAMNDFTPNFRFAAVHEHEDDARDIETRLVLSPDSVFTLQTDSPDRNYLTGGFGLAGTLKSGAQWYIDYERRFEHDFLDNWAASAGFLLVF